MFTVEIFQYTRIFLQIVLYYTGTINKEYIKHERFKTKIND